MRTLLVKILNFFYLRMLYPTTQFKKFALSAKGKFHDETSEILKENKLDLKDLSHGLQTANMPATAKVATKKLGIR